MPFLQVSGRRAVDDNLNVSLACSPGTNLKVEEIHVGFLRLNGARPRPTHGVNQVTQISAAIQVIDQFQRHRFLTMGRAAHRIQVKVQRDTIVRKIQLDISA